MIDVEDYDELLAAAYAAGEGGGSVGELLRRLAVLLRAAQAGFLVFDQADSTVTHGIVAPTTANALDGQNRLGDMNAQPGIRALSTRRLAAPRRFTDLVPRGRLRQSTWFRRQEAIAGVGYGIAVDLGIGGVRVRLFAMRAAGAEDFEAAPLQLLGRVARHIERAFAAAPHRLAPRHQDEGTTVLIYRADALAGAMQGARSLEARLVARFGLTPAEARVAAAAGSGEARAALAARLGLSLNSVKTHLRRIHSKLGVARAGELVRVLHAMDTDVGAPAAGGSRLLSPAGYDAGRSREEGSPCRR